MNNYDISELENTLRAILRNAGVADKVYLNRPKASDPAACFAVVTVTGSLTDLECYATGTVYFYLFARDVKEEKNGKKLSLMYGKLVEAVPRRSGRYIFDENPTLIGDTGDDYGFHCRVVRMKVTVISPEAKL